MTETKLLKAETRNCEFEEWKTETLGFRSTWKSARQYDSATAQTDPIPLKEIGVQSENKIPKAVQTDDDEKEITVNTIQPPYPPSLYAFFSRVTDTVCQCLEENMDPFSVEVFRDFGEEEEDLKKEAVKEFTLRSKSLPQDEEVAAACIAWNRNGTQIAVGYCVEQHPEWCHHRFPLTSWNLRKMQSKKGSEYVAPHAEVNLPGCMTCMEFHPLHPSVLAVGNYNGCVAIVDLSEVHVGTKKEGIPSEEGKSNDEVSSSIRKGEGQSRNRSKPQGGHLGYYVSRPEHSFPVSSVHWMTLTAAQSSQLILKNRNASQFCLVSSGKEGCICLWSTNTSNTRIYLEKKFIAWADSIPSDVPLSLSTRCQLKQVGIVGLGPCRDDPATCVIVTTGGFIFQAHLDSNIEAYSAMFEAQSEEKSTKSSEMLIDPNLTYVSIFRGMPQVIAASPFHRDVFLVGNSNGDVIVQNMLQGAPMHKVELGGVLSDVKWSGRPAMFGVASQNLVQVVDLQKGSSPALTIPHEHVVTGIAFSGVEVGTLATCDVEGVVHVWNLPKSLSSVEPNELNLLLKPPLKDYSSGKEGGDGDNADNGHDRSSDDE